MAIVKSGLVWMAAAAAAMAQDASRAVVQKVCGTCHTPESVISGHRTRAQWQETIDQMITSRGAKGTPDEFAAVLDYLTANFGPAAEGRGGRAGRGAAAPRSVAMSAGPDDKHVVDDAAADRGRKVWATECINCHGTYARGTDDGPNLIRSEVVLHDRYGDHIGPFLRQGHKMQSGASAATLTAAQIGDLSHFIHQRVYDTLRGSPIFVMHDILTGNAADGKTYFNGAGRCATCHSPTGDLKGIGAKIGDAKALQQMWLAPGGGGRGGAPANAPPVTATIALPGGEKVFGRLVRLDDFTVTVEVDGAPRSFLRHGDVPKVEVKDPLEPHRQLLPVYTDKDIHDVTAYLATLR